ncbi:MAG: mechanosensitive ion channel [Leptospiraceae bacterium]|nr:mechanosensitive ion channel [Leptospiraceae bacterium]
MSNFEFDISHLSLWEYGLTGFILLIVLFLSGLFLEKLGHKNPLINRFKRLFPSFQIGFVLAYALWTISRVFVLNPLYYFLLSLSVLIVCTILGWNFLKDVLWGSIFKAENSFSHGSEIRIEGFEGVIKKLGFRSIQIMGEDGNVVRIPYSKISNQPIQEVNLDSGRVGHTFTIVTELGSPEEMIHKITNVILNHPYSSINQKPIIKMIKSDNDQILLEVTVFSLGGNYHNDIEASIKKEKLSF